MTGDTETEKMAATVTEAVTRRKSTRQFLDKPVTREQLEEILALARYSPSGSNMQPWKVYAFTGDALTEATTKFGTTIMSGQLEQRPSFPTYPDTSLQPHTGRRFECAERMYSAIGIPRADKQSRMAQVLKNYVFFGAPVGIIITMHDGLSEAQAIDVGIFVQTLMLLATERGLHTCPQLAWSIWPQAVKDAFDVPAEERIMMGISLGYRDDSSPINEVEQTRQPVGEFARLTGF